MCTFTGSIDRVSCRSATAAVTTAGRNHTWTSGSGVIDRGHEDVSTWSAFCAGLGVRSTAPDRPTGAAAAGSCPEARIEHALHLGRCRDKRDRAAERTWTHPGVGAKLREVDG